MFLLIRRKERAGLRRSIREGFTLLELMLAMALTLVVLAAVVVLFDRMYDLGETAAAISEVNQNVRASINLIARDLTMAGTGIPIGGLPIPNGTPSAQVKRPLSPFLPVQYFPNATGVLSVITPAIGLGPTVLGQASDAIHIFAVPPTTSFRNVPLVSINPAGTQITLASGPVGIGIGDTLMLTASTGQALGMVTAVDPTNHTINFDSTDPIQLNQPTAFAGKIASLNPGSGYPPTVATQVQLITYYLENSGGGPVRLMRQVGAPDPPAHPNPPAPVAMNIVALEFTYDLADGTTKTINTKADADAKPYLIRKVNLKVTGRSSQPLRRTHQYFANTMTTAVTIRNLEYKSKY